MTRKRSFDKTQYHFVQDTAVQYELDLSMKLKISYMKKSAMLKIRLKVEKKTEIPKAFGGIYQLKHTLVFTMIDAKIFHAARNTSSRMRCYKKISTTAIKKLYKTYHIKHL